MVELRYVGFDIINSKIITYTWNGNVFVESYATKQIQNYIAHTILINNSISYLYIYDDGFTHVYTWDSNWIDLNIAYDDVPEHNIISAPFLNSNKSLYVSETNNESETGNEILIKKTLPDLIGNISSSSTIPIVNSVNIKLHNIGNNKTILSGYDHITSTLTFYNIDIDLNTNSVMQVISDSINSSSIMSFLIDSETYLIYSTDTNIKLYKFDNTNSVFNLIQTYTSTVTVSDYTIINNIEFVSDNNRENSYIVITTTGSNVATFIKFNANTNTLSPTAHQILNNSESILKLSAFSTYDNFGNYLGISSPNYLNMYKHGLTGNNPTFHRHSTTKFNSSLINTSFYNF